MLVCFRITLLSFFLSILNPVISNAENEVSSEKLKEALVNKSAVLQTVYEEVYGLTQTSIIQTDYELRKLVTEYLLSLKYEDDPMYAVPQVACWLGGEEGANVLEQWLSKVELNELDFSLGNFVWILSATLNKREMLMFDRLVEMGVPIEENILLQLVWESDNDPKWAKSILKKVLSIKSVKPTEFVLLQAVNWKSVDPGVVEILLNAGAPITIETLFYAKNWSKEEQDQADHEKVLQLLKENFYR